MSDVLIDRVWLVECYRCANEGTSDEARKDDAVAGGLGVVATWLPSVGVAARCTSSASGPSPTTSGGAMMATEVVLGAYDRPVTRDEIEEAIIYHNNHVSRMPKHWVERRAGIHKIINDLLDQRDNTPA